MGPGSGYLIIIQVKLIKMLIYTKFRISTITVRASAALLPIKKFSSLHPWAPDALYAICWCPNFISDHELTALCWTVRTFQEPGFEFFTREIMLSEDLSLSISSFFLCLLTRPLSLWLPCDSFQSYSIQPEFILTTWCSQYISKILNFLGCPLIISGVGYYNKIKSIITQNVIIFTLIIFIELYLI